MQCGKIEGMLKEKEGVKDMAAGLESHIGECPDCRKCFFLLNILNSRKGAPLEKTPETVMINVRRKIYELEKERENRAWSATGGRFLKPAIAFAALVLGFAAYFYFNNTVGFVQNLVERFDIPEMRCLKRGEILYAAENTHVDFKLKNSARLQLDSNALIHLKAENRVFLSRGQLYLSVANRKMEIETPNGVITLKKAKTRIRTTMSKENGAPVTTCVVFDGDAQINNFKGTASISPGQEVILTENGNIQFKNILRDKTLQEEVSRFDFPAGTRVYSAIEQLCDCLYDKKFDYDHSRKHGKNYKENRFPVRVFWRNKLDIESRAGNAERLCFFNLQNSAAHRL